MHEMWGVKMENKTYASILTIEKTNPIWANIEFRNYVESMIARYLGLKLDENSINSIAWFTDEKDQKVLLVDEAVIANIAKDLDEIDAFIIGVLTGMSFTEKSKVDKKAKEKINE